ncbi:hypothetical protein [Chitinivibrio alkaliphilus]|nr:hypothetical protein [Chitinivibrio alkaliphilus]
MIFLCSMHIAGVEIPQTLDDVHLLYREGVLSAEDAERYEDLILTPLIPSKEGWERLLALSSFSVSTELPSATTVALYIDHAEKHEDDFFSRYPELYPYAHLIDLTAQPHLFSGDVRLTHRQNPYYGHRGGRISGKVQVDEKLELQASLAATDTSVYWHERALVTTPSSKCSLSIGSYTLPPNPLVWGDLSKSSRTAATGSFLTPYRAMWNGVSFFHAGRHGPSRVFVHSRGSGILGGAMSSYETSSAEYGVGAFGGSLPGSGVLFVRRETSRGRMDLVLTEEKRWAFWGEFRNSRGARSGHTAVSFVQEGYYAPFATQYTTLKRVRPQNDQAGFIEHRGQYRTGVVRLYRHIVLAFSEAAQYQSILGGVTVYSPLYLRTSLARTYETVRDVSVRLTWEKEGRWSPLEWMDVIFRASQRYEYTRWVRAFLRQEIRLHLDQMQATGTLFFRQQVWRDRIMPYVGIGLRREGSHGGYGFRVQGPPGKDFISRGVIHGNFSYSF